MNTKIFSSKLLTKILHQLIPNIGTVLVVAALLFVNNVRAASLSAGTSPSTISYQGTLSTASGTPVNASVGITFRLYNVQSGGSALWTEAHTGANVVPVNNGLFNVLLGSVTPIPSAVWDNATVYLGVQVEGDSAELSPREIVSAVPMAMMTANLTIPDGSITTAKIADGSVTTAKIGFRLPRLLGYDNCESCGDVTETLGEGWNLVKGANAQDIVETTVTTDGGPVLAQMTMRRSTALPIETFCYIRILNQAGSWIRGAHVDSDTPAYSGAVCSGAYLFPDLPAGTYRFQLLVWAGAVTSATWHFERQIVVFQY